MAYLLLHTGQPSARRLLKKLPQLRRYHSYNATTDRDVVFRWGLSSESDPILGHVLNARQAVHRTQSRSTMGRFLRRVGVRYAWADPVRQDGSPRFVRHFRVPMFDLKPLAIFKADGSEVWVSERIQRIPESFREFPPDDDKLSTRVGHYARRTLHALGLDYGLVSIGMAQRGVLYVYDVTPFPVLDGRLLDLYAGAFRMFMDQTDLVRNATTPQVVLGTDMELMLSNQTGKIVLASNYLPRKGVVGCDDRSIAYDGRRLPLMELRPSPDADPLVLMHNLRSAMEEALRIIDRPKVEWRAGSMPFRPYSTGGHIHFTGIPLTARLVRVLDNYVGLPLMMVEDPETANLRRPRYGFLGDVRPKDHGGFEYRTPASFVLDADVTAAALCLAHLVATYHRELSVVDLYEPRTQQAFYQGRRETLLPIVNHNFSELTRLAGYQRYRDYIEPLHRMIQAGRSWDETVDVRTVWGLPISLRSRRVTTRSRSAPVARAMQ